MLIGAFLMIVFQVVGLGAALESINLDVIGFLFGMFSIVAALDKSGVLRLVAVKRLSRANNLDSLLLIFVIGMGILSAFLVNDTMALIAVPLLIYISRHVGQREKKEIIRSLCKSFLTESDKLKPIKYISSEVTKSEDKDFLVPESLKSKLKVLGTFLGVSVPIVISIITLYLTLTKH